MALTAVTYGTFNLNDGVNYYVVGRDAPSFTPIAQTYYKVGRLEGMKKTGEVVNEKTIKIDMVIIGTSRTDLENKIDAMQQALYLRGQALKVRTNDSRYYLADCVDCQIAFKPGNVLYCDCTLVFACTQPFAYSSTTSTYDTGTVTLSLLSGTTYKFATQSVTGGGTVFCRPQIRLYKRDATAVWSSVKIIQNTDSQTLTINSNLPTTNGGYIDIYCDPLNARGFAVYLNSTTTQCTFSGIFPVLETTATSFDIQITTSATGTFSAEAVWTWVPRWLS